MDKFIVSARKYRPAGFDDVVGQESITRFDQKKKKRPKKRRHKHQNNRNQKNKNNQNNDKNKKS